MTFKELLLLLILPLGIMSVSLYTAHINYKIAKESINRASTIPSIDSLRIRVHKEGKATTEENMTSFLSGLRKLLINQEQNKANLSELIYKHFVTQIIFSFLWCVLVICVYRANKERTRRSNN